MPSIIHRLFWFVRTPGRVALLYVVGACLWIYLSSWLLQLGVDDNLLLRQLELTKGIGFVALTGLMLFLLLRVWGNHGDTEAMEEGVGAARFHSSLRRLFAIFVILILLVTLLGYFIFAHESRHLEQGAFNKLRVITELKSERVWHWLEERHNDARTLTEDASFVRQVAQLGEGEASAQAALYERLSAFSEAYGYEGLMLAGPDGARLLEMGVLHDPSRLEKTELAPARTNGVGYTHFFRDADGRLHMDLFIPLFSTNGGSSHVGFLLIHSSPEEKLFPYIWNWPSEKSSGSSLLVREDGALLEFLEGGPGRGVDSGMVDYPLVMPGGPGSSALSGEVSGIFSGVDYRGVSVLAAYHQVPGTDWKIMTKIDQHEVLEPLYALMRWVGMISLFSLSVLVFSLWILWRQQQRMYALSMQAEKEKSEAVRVGIEKALQESESRLRTLVHTIPDLVWLKDVDGEYMLCNPMFERFFGATEHEIRGRTDYDFVSREQADFFRDNDRRAMHAGEPSINEEWLTFRSDGHQGLFETIKTPMLDSTGELIGILGIARDITRRKQAEDELRLAARVFEQSREGIIITDAQARILKINRAFTEITGYTEAEALGQRPSLLSSGRHDRDFYRRLWEHLRRNGYWQGEIWNRRKDGEVYPQWLSIVRTYDASREVAGHIAIFEDITQRKQDEERIHWLAHFDPLTGLPNRTLLLDRSATALARARREGRSLAILYCDLDHFKNINDTLGHTVGDGLLKEVAARLSRVLREQDTVSRQGGDEFVVLLPDTDSNGAAHVCQNILAVMSEPCAIADHELNVSFSVGVSIHPDDGDDFEVLAKNADIAMYRAKQTGRNNYCFFTPELHGMTARTIRLETDIQRALEREELLLHYQPQVDIASGRISGFEALLRWRHPELGMVSPAEFIPIAERSGQIVRIGEWVARTAAAQLRQWQDAGLPRLKMAVNLSVPQLQQARLFESIRDILDTAGLAPQLFELEVTESMLMEDPEKSVATLRRLNEYGVRIAIDDFGTGYSSLAYLKRLPVNYLKIDKAFIQDILDDPDDATIARSIISLGHSLGLQIIAEGVETEAQLEFLRTQGCDHMQGYLFSRPLARDEMTALLADSRYLDSSRTG